MFKSIFTKYVLTFMLITVISFALLTAIIFSIITGYYNDNLKVQLLQDNLSVSELLTEGFKHSKEPTLKEYLTAKQEQEQISSFLSAYRQSGLSVFVTDLHGNVLVSSGIPEWNGKTELRLTESIIDAALHNGYSDKGNLGGLISKSQNCSGVKITDGYGGTIGAVFMIGSQEGLSSLMDASTKTVIMTCLWVMLATLIAVYFISEKIVTPLKAMGRAAKSFAAGKFDVRVEVRGHDEISELAVAFNNMASSLSDIENMRSTFLSNVSHDLRTPMTTISGFIDGILDGTIPREKHEYYLRMISDEVRRLSRLVAALLDVSRIQAGDRKFVFGTFDICEMARIILISFEQKLDRKKLDVSFETDAENMYVYADRDAIYQILYNICDNAVKFSREEGVYRIRITEHDKKVFVSVYNEGVGIDAESLPQVFERFYKADKSRSLDKTGTGLGLYIAKSIIDAHGEEIWVKSTYGEYCEFIFTLRPASDSEIKKMFEKKFAEGEELRR